jgi:cell wall-associated NlpC family hydrolase
MVKVAANKVAYNARWLIEGRIIPYVATGRSMAGMDCQGMVKYCVKQAMGNCDHYSGSNDMFRGCVNAGTAREYGENGLKPGMLVFTVERSGREPSRYKADGLGNASHVGIAVMESDDIWTIDASESAGKVRGRSRAQAPKVWTHMATARTATTAFARTN